MRRQLWHVPLLGVVLFACGCSTPIEIIDYRCGQVAHVSTAPTAETYTLMDEKSKLRVESTTFDFAEDIGFARQNGALEAVAGDERIPLTEGNYSWVIERPQFALPESTGPVKWRPVREPSAWHTHWAAGRW